MRLSNTIERYFCPGHDTYLTDAVAEAIIKSCMKAEDIPQMAWGASRGKTRTVIGPFFFAKF